MIVGCPKEIKNEEYRVGMTPNGVKEFVRAGHTVHRRGRRRYRLGLQ